MTHSTYLLALDQGACNCRAIVFDDRKRIVGTAQQVLANAA